jgi:hypothetical protein
MIRIVLAAVLLFLCSGVLPADEIVLSPPNYSVIPIKAVGGQISMEVSGPVAGLLVSWDAPIGCYYVINWPAFPTSSIDIHCFAGWVGDAHGFPFKVQEYDKPGFTAYYTILVTE